ncbi:MAG: hypothetical protein R3270_11500, partial [Gammaproteobacteria bacterium]|nr:hypothetical protein [Gammaproteobacteria bacterium]
MIRVPAALLLSSLLGLVASGTAHGAEETKVLDFQYMVTLSSQTTLENNDFFDRGAFSPAAAINPRDAEPGSGFIPSKIMVVAWSSDSELHVVDRGEDAESTADDLNLADDEYEIFIKTLETRISNNTVFEFTDELRISSMGPDDETDPVERARYQAFAPSVAYNPESDQFLVVWYGDDNTAPLVDGEYEIWGRLIGGSATAADLVDNEPFRITITGPEGEADPVERARYAAMDPKVAYNPATGGYMLVYRADDANISAASGGTLADDEFEILAQMLAADGSRDGAPIRVSTMGDDSETDPAIRAEYDAVAPELVYNPIAGQFLVAWQGDTNLNGLVNDENEIYVRGINTDGTMPNPQQRVSAMGPDGDAAFDANAPTLAVNADSGEYLVAWSGDDNTAPLVDEEFEIFGRLLNTTGVPANAAFRISTMGDDAATDPQVRASFDAITPSAAYHEGSQRYQVSWSGDDNTAPLVEGEMQVFGQGVNADGSLAGSRFQLSEINEAGETAAERRQNSARNPLAIFAAGTVQHFFEADDPGLSNPDTGESGGHFEIFLRRASSVTATVRADVPERAESSDGAIRSDVPEPLEFSYVVTNDGPDTLVNNSV